MAVSLLTLALSLLVAAQQPHVPLDIKNTAISVAQNAIKVALEEQSKTSPTQVSVPIEAATSTKVENAKDADATDFPIVGTLQDGRPIYQGTGLFVIGTNGCHYAVAGGSVGPPTYCPEN